MYLAATVLAVVSCQEQAVPDMPKGTLSFSLGYDGSEYVDIATKADFEISKMAVVIETAEGDEVLSYADASSMPAEIELEPGQYSVRAYTSNVSAAAFDNQSFSGTKDFEIIQDENTAVALVCTLDNVKVSVKLDASFTELIADYSVTVTALDYDKALVFAPEDIEAGRSGYFAVSPLQVNVIGRRISDDGQVNIVSTIEDVKARDHFILNISVSDTPQAEGTGAIDISFDDSTNDRVVDIEVPGDPEPEIGTAPEIAFSCPEDVTFTDAEAAGATVDVTVTAENGIENLYVKIESQELLFMLSMLPMSDAVKSGNWDIANIDDDGLAEFLGGLGLHDPSAPIKGKTEHTFSIGAFMSLMPASDNPYPFAIRVVDSQGLEAERTLTVHRVKE